MKPSRIELEQAAVLFRNRDPNLTGTDMLRLICAVGGIIAVKYGYWMSESHRRPKATAYLRDEIANLLDTTLRMAPRKQRYQQAVNENENTDHPRLQI